MYDAPPYTWCSVLLLLTTRCQYMSRNVSPVQCEAVEVYRFESCVPAVNYIMWLSGSQWSKCIFFMVVFVYTKTLRKGRVSYGLRTPQCFWYLVHRAPAAWINLSFSPKKGISCNLLSLILCKGKSGGGGGGLKIRKMKGWRLHRIHFNRIFVWWNRIVFLEY